MRLIDDWRKAHRFLSIRIALAGVLFWSVIGGLWIIWPVLADKIPLGIYIGAGLSLSVAVGVGRYLKQPGLDQ